MDFDQNAPQFGRCQHVAHPVQHLFLKTLDIHLDHVRCTAQAFAYGIATADLYGPRWSPQKRPYVVTSKPAIEIGLRRDCFTVPRCT